MSRIIAKTRKIDFVTHMWRCKYCRRTEHENPIKTVVENGPVTLIDDSHLDLDTQIKVMELRVELAKLHVQMAELEERDKQCYPDFPVSQPHEWEEIGGGIVIQYSEYLLCPKCESGRDYVPHCSDNYWIVLKEDQITHRFSTGRTNLDQGRLACGILFRRCTWTKESPFKYEKADDLPTLL